MKDFSNTLGWERVEKWFKKEKWNIFEFQKETWEAFLNNKSGLIHSSTGTGKTIAAFLGPVIRCLNSIYCSESKTERKNSPELFRILWITPLRALANDTFINISKIVKEFNINWKVELRTGDTSSHVKEKQKRKLPTVLITTPESLSLLLSYENSSSLFSSIEVVFVDELHELIGSKRGVLAELALARLKTLNRNVQIWGMSATLGNTATAKDVLLGNSSESGVMIRSDIKKKIEIKTIIPEKVERFPRAGHLGVKMLQEVLKIIENANTSLIFTNTRSQTEIWFQEILSAKPGLNGKIALHHGSLSRDERRDIEDSLRSGNLRSVVATSSLDLGVDFTPVDVVVQIGSPKGIARMLQRAGRSGHKPESISKLYCIPTNSFELIEFAAAESGIKKGFIEPRIPVEESLDVLAQHAVTIAAGPGFYKMDFFNEVRTAYSFRNLKEREWEWVLNFITRGGDSLRAYPEYSKVAEEKGFYIVKDKTIAKRHRLSVGTITADASIVIKFLHGKTLGTAEESFITKLKPGDEFIFSGRNLQFVRLRDLTAYVRKGAGNKGSIAQWMGGRMPLSTELAAEVREQLKNSQFNSDNYLIKALKPLLDLQNKWSLIPSENQLLVEKIKTREGLHHFIYPFEGKLIHEGLSSLIAFRISKKETISFTISTNDYGFEILSNKDFSIKDFINEGLFSSENLSCHILESINSSELAKRRFREIARIAGLVFQGYPGKSKAARHLQASSGLFYEVFKKYDPENLLLRQAVNEVLQNQLEIVRIKNTLERISGSEIKIIDIPYITPLAFPLMVNRMREKLSSEKLSERIEKMKAQLEKAADK